MDVADRRIRGKQRMKKCVLAVLAAVLVILALPVLAEEAGYPELVFDVPKQEYSVTEKDVFFIPVDYKGMPFENIEHRVTSERFFYYYVDPLGVHVFPIASGTATISLVNKKNQEDKTLLFITVEESAVDRKGHDNPLRAFITVDETIVTGDEIRGKYIILGGSGKNEHINLWYEKVSGGKDELKQRFWVYDPARRAGKIKYNLDLEDGEYYKFTLEVWDSDLNRTEASSQLVRIKKPSDLKVMLDTIPIYTAKDRGFRFNYFIKDGRDPLTVAFFYVDNEGDTLKKKQDGALRTNKVKYDLPDVVPYLDDYYTYGYLEVTDDAKTTARQYYSATNNGDRELLLKTDTPFAQVGDQVHCQIVKSGEDWTWKELRKLRQYRFYYIEPLVWNDGEFEYVRMKRMKAESALNIFTYTVDCKRPGHIYVCTGEDYEDVIGEVAYVE